MIELIAVFITGIFSTLGVAYVFYKFADVEEKFQKKSFMIFVFGVIFITLVQFLKIESLGNIMFFIFYPVLFYFMKKMSFKKLFYYVIIIWFYGTLLDLVAMLVVAGLNSYYDFNVYNIYFECALSILIFILLIILGNNKWVRKFTDYLYKKLINLNHIDIALAIFSIFTLSMSVVIFFNLTNLSIGILIFIIVVLMLFMLILLIKYKIDAYENSLFLKTLKENNDFYIKINDENRIFRHNLNAKLYSIKSISNRRTKMLINDLLLQNNRNIVLAENFKDMPYGLNGIIYEKVYPYMDKINIKVENNIKSDVFMVLKPRRYNVFIEKLVVALDNAIEASLNSKEKILIINSEEDSECLRILINNSFSNDISMNNLGKNGYSTKGTKRGLGLFSILRNNEASTKIKIVNNIFISEIECKKKVIDK